MALPGGFTEELIERCDIVNVIEDYMPLKSSGSNYVGLCPFHSEKTPSFMVSPSKQIFKCFGCGEGGNVISFVMKHENLSFTDAVRKLCDRCGMTFPENDEPDFNVRSRILELNREAARYFFDNLHGDEGKPAAQYLLKRGLTSAAIRSFGIGYAGSAWDGLLRAMTKKGFSESELLAAKLISTGKNGGRYDFFRERVMFPIIDVRGNVIAFSGRVLTSGDEGRKYVNSPDTPVYSKSRALFGINLAKKTKSDFLLLVEGNMDVVSLHSAGFDSAIATCGTALTPLQAQLMKKYASKAVICFDQDAAGQKATDKAIGILSAADIDVRVLRLPERRDENGNAVKDDPDSFIKRQGADAFRKLLSKPPSDVEYKLSEIKSNADLSSDNGRIAYLKEAARYLATVPNDIEREIYTRNTALDAALSEQALLSEVARIRASLLREKKKKTAAGAANPLSVIQPQERGLRYEDPAAAASEERLLVLCLSYPELLKTAEASVKPSDFSSALLASLYEKTLEMSKEGRMISSATLLSGLEEKETRHLSGVLTAALPSEDPAAELSKLINNITLAHIKRTGGSADVLSVMLAEKRKRGNDNAGTNS